MKALPLTGAVFLNRRVVAAARARVSVFDRGLLYGDGLFETLRAYRGRVFALDLHLARLHDTARFLGIAVPAIDWARQITAVLRRNHAQATDAAVRITLTRGAARPGLLPPADAQPTVLIMTTPIEPAIAHVQRLGVRVVLLPFAREGLLAGRKLLHYVPAILGRVIAGQQHAFEGLYVDGMNRLSEGTTSNVFLCRGSEVLTPPAQSGVLPGVTRRLVIDLAVAARLRVRERPMSVTDLLDADEAFCTSSVVEVVPIVRAGDRVIGNGRPGPITRRVQRLYRAMIERHVARALS